MHSPPPKQSNELRIHLPGTGDRNYPIIDQLIDDRKFTQDANVDILYLKDCTHPSICNAEYFPDIKLFIKNLATGLSPTNQLVQRQQLRESLNRNKLECKFGHPDETYYQQRWQGLQPNSLEITGPEYKIPDAILFTNDQYKDKYAAYLDKKLEPDITKYNFIRLIGSSRGAASCFLLAKELHNKGVTTPISIHAYEPVSGHSVHHSWLSECTDLTHCSNIEFCYITLGALQHSPQSKDVKTTWKQYLANSFHATFLKQCFPKFHTNTILKVKVLEKKFNHGDYDSTNEFPLQTPQQLMQVYGGYSRELIFSLAKHKSPSKNPVNDEAKIDNANDINTDNEIILPVIRQQLIKFIIEIRRNTSFNYRLYFRSRRKEDYLNLIELDIRQEKEITILKTQQQITDIFNTVSMQRGIFQQTTSLQKFNSLLLRGEYADLNAFITNMREQNMLPEMLANSQEDKARHYASRLALDS